MCYGLLVQFLKQCLSCLVHIQSVHGVIAEIAADGFDDFLRAGGILFIELIEQLKVLRAGALQVGTNRPERTIGIRIDNMRVAWRIMLSASLRA